RRYRGAVHLWPARRLLGTAQGRRTHHLALRTTPRSVAGLCGGPSVAGGGAMTLRRTFVGREVEPAERDPGRGWLRGRFGLAQSGVAACGRQSCVICSEAPIRCEELHPEPTGVPEQVGRPLSDLLRQ